MSAWVVDPREPSGWRWDAELDPDPKNATAAIPLHVEYGGVRDVPSPSPRTFTHPDGSTYRRAHPDDFDDFDDIDSTTIVDPGAPD